MIGDLAVRLRDGGIGLNEHLLRRQQIEIAQHPRLPAALRQAERARGVLVVVAEDYIQHNPHPEQGLNGLIAFFEQQLRDMPDLKGEIEVLVSEGDLVAAKTKVSGTKDGRPAESQIADFWRVEDGKLKEHW